MKLSIVTTMYWSETYLEEFYQRCKTEVQKITDDYEIIFVNDGSPDNSLQKAIELSQRDDQVMVVDLSRNFGHHKAMMTGLSYTSGELVFLIDSDLEEEPELLQIFYSRLTKENCDVVFGVQKSRKGNFFEKWSGEIFHRFINYLSELNIPKNMATARLMSRRYVDSLLEFREHELFIAGIWHITGFNQVPVEVVKHSTSKTTYKLKNKVAVAINAITSFSNKPLLLIFNLGMTITVISFFYILYLVVRKVLYSQSLIGWTSLIVSVWFIGGLIISFIGIVGIYLSKIFIETKSRPYTIIRDVYGGNHDKDK
ncbi:MAG: glycosyltransferase family 2 protein [Firmicutes bacterium]|nr:glycosyltransferase family 2 protein [Bacillota bacterium]